MPNGWPGELDDGLSHSRDLDCAMTPASHSKTSGGHVKRFIVSLPDALNEQLRKAAAAGGESVAVWVREAIRQRLEREQ